MKADVAFGRVGFEIRGGIANLKSHCKDLRILMGAGHLGGDRRAHHIDLQERQLNNLLAAKNARFARARACGMK
jgi:hypothetical protein